MERERDEIEIDLREIFLVLKKRFLVILLTVFMWRSRYMRRRRNFT